MRRYFLHKIGSISSTRTFLMSCTLTCRTWNHKCRMKAWSSLALVSFHLLSVCCCSAIAPARCGSSSSLARCGIAALIYRGAPASPSSLPSSNRPMCVHTYYQSGPSRSKICVCRVPIMRSRAASGTDRCAGRNTAHYCAYLRCCCS